MLLLFSRLIMHLLNNNALKCLTSLQSNVGKTITRTLINPFGSKSIEAAKDAHSNLLTNTEHVFEVQHHTVKPSSMVKRYFSLVFKTKIKIQGKYKNFVLKLIIKIIEKRFNIH